MRYEDTIIPNKTLRLFGLAKPVNSGKVIITILLGTPLVESMAGVCTTWQHVRKSKIHCYSVSAGPKLLYFCVFWCAHTHTLICVLEPLELINSSLVYVASWESPGLEITSFAMWKLITIHVLLRCHRKPVHHTLKKRHGEKVHKWQVNSKLLRWNFDADGYRLDLTETRPFPNANFFGICWGHHATLNVGCPFVEHQNLWEAGRHCVWKSLVWKGKPSENSLDSRVSIL